MQSTHVVGVDPGLVHTGCVRLVFRHRLRLLTVEHEAVAGTDHADQVADWINVPDVAPHIFIEGYRPRSNLSSDARMVTAVSEIRKATGGTVLQNMGVKKVVRKPLLELLHCWKFSTVTHHQDLRSAAYIAVLGMLKDEQLNQVLTRFVVDHLEGRDWDVSAQ